MSKIAKSKRIRGKWNSKRILLLEDGYQDILITRRAYGCRGAWHLSASSTIHNQDSTLPIPPDRSLRDRCAELRITLASVGVTHSAHRQDAAERCQWISYEGAPGHGIQRRLPRLEHRAVAYTVGARQPLPDGEETNGWAGSK